MPTAKSKPLSGSKPDKSKKSSKSSGEIGDDDLRSVSGGLAATDGISSPKGGCVSQS